MLAGAAWRLTALTAVGSVALLPWLGTDLTGVLVGYGLIALATMLIGIMDALGRPSLGVVAVAASVACALAVRALDPARRRRGAGLRRGGGGIAAPARGAGPARPAGAHAGDLGVDHVSRVGFIASLTAGVVLLAATLSSRAGERRSGCSGSLVPAYLSPDAMLALVASSPRPLVLVVNPGSGPGAAPDPEYRRAIAAAQAAGSRVLGYVPTTWGARPVADVEADVERYRTWYSVNGVFFDEAASDEAHIGHYRALVDHARAKGATFVVLNPGLVPARGYFEIADVVVTFEGPIAAYRAHRPARRHRGRAQCAPRLRRLARAGAAGAVLDPDGPLRLLDLGHAPPSVGNRAGLLRAGALRAQGMPMNEHEDRLWARQPRGRHSDLYDHEYAKQLERIARHTQRGQRFAGGRRGRTRRGSRPRRAPRPRRVPRPRRALRPRRVPRSAPSPETASGRKIAPSYDAAPSHDAAPSRETPPRPAAAPSRDTALGRPAAPGRRPRRATRPRRAARPRRAEAGRASRETGPERSAAPGARPRRATTPLRAARQRPCTRSPRGGRPRRRRPAAPGGDWDHSLGCRAGGLRTAEAAAAASIQSGPPTPPAGDAPARRDAAPAPLAADGPGRARRDPPRPPTSLAADAATRREPPASLAADASDRREPPLVGDARNRREPPASLAADASDRREPPLAGDARDRRELPAPLVGDAQARREPLTPLAGHAAARREPPTPLAGDLFARHTASVPLIGEGPDRHEPLPAGDASARRDASHHPRPGAVRGPAPSIDSALRHLAVVPPAPTEPSDPVTSQRHTRWLIAVAALALLLGGGAAFLATRAPEAPAATVFHVPGPPTGLVAASGQVWVAGPTAGAVWVLDAASGKAAAPALRPGGAPARLALGGRFAWIADTQGSAVIRAPRAGQGALRSFPTGPDLSDVIVAAGTVWTASSADGTVRAIGPARAAMSCMSASGRSRWPATPVGCSCSTPPGSSSGSMR